MTESNPFRKVAIHGVPRSGTSWLGEVLNSSPHTLYRYQPLFSYAHKDYLNDHSPRSDIEAFFERLYTCDDDFTNQKGRRASGDFPTFNKSTISHVVYKEVRYMNILDNLLGQADDVYLLAVIRNPLSVLNSWFRAPREFRRDLGWSEREEWRYACKKNLDRPENFYGYERWKEAASLFLRLQETYPQRVHVVVYSDLLKNTRAEVARIFDFLGLALTRQTLGFISASSRTDNEDVYSVYRRDQSDDKWKGELDEQIVASVYDDLGGTRLARFLE